MKSLPISVGAGLRLPHLAEMVETVPSVGWLEIHPENFVANPHASELLTELSLHYAISVHTVGISIGSITGIDRVHLKRLRALVERIRAAAVSGHLAWSNYGAEFLNDLLPLPYNEESLRTVAAHLREVEDTLGRPYLIENPSSYLAFRSSTMSEAEFLNELVDRTGCRLLCDVSNVYLSAHNLGYDARNYLDSLPADAIDELHLGGFTVESGESNVDGELWIDTHDAPVADAAWELYAYALNRFGKKPTLIEWDSDLPRLERLLEEVRGAERILCAEQEPEYAGTR